jgi:hypothetical protein
MRWVGRYLCAVGVDHPRSEILPSNGFKFKRSEEFRILLQGEAEVRET